MNIQKIICTFTVVAAFGLVACSGDTNTTTIPVSGNTDKEDSSTDQDQEFVPSIHDDVACTFKDSDKGFDMVVTIDEREVHTVLGFCDDDACKIETDQKIDGKNVDKPGVESRKFSDGEKEALLWIGQQKKIYNYECSAIDKMDRSTYAIAEELRGQMTCELQDSSETHYKQHYKRGGVDLVSEYTLKGDTLFIEYSKAIQEGAKEPAECTQEKDAESTKTYTCKDGYLTESDFVVYKNEDEAKKGFADVVKDTEKRCDIF